MRRPSATLRARLWLLPVLLLVIVWLPGADQGAFRVDTGLYAALGLHAWRDGPLWPLHAGDAPYFNKPPLAILAHGAFLQLTGASLWAARLPSLVVAAACVLLLRRAARALVGARAAWLTACVLALTLEFFRYSRAISLDLWVTMFLLMSACGVLSGMRREKSSWLIVLAGLPLGLSLLVKPIAPLLVVPIFAAWLTVDAGRPREVMNRLVALLGATCAAIATASLWYVPMYRRFGDEFITQHFTKQAVERATGESFGADPWWYYLQLLGESYWPWLVAVVVVVVLMLRGRLGARDRRFAIGALVWFVAWLVALSAFAGKSGRYAVPMYPAMACLAAIVLARRAPRWVTLMRRAAVRWLAPIGLGVSVLLVALGIRVHGPPTPHWEAVYELVRSNPTREFWAAPGMMPTCANIYLATGRWPRSVEVSVPTPGAFVLYRDEIEARPAAGEVEAWRTGPLYAVMVPGG